MQIFVLYDNIYRNKIAKRSRTDIGIRALGFLFRLQLSLALWPWAIYLSLFLQLKKKI
jgi:hypothetical protein